MPKKKDNCEKNNHSFKAEIAEGGFGKVVGSCKNKDCKYVAKIQYLDEPVYAEAYIKELYFYNKLKNETVNGVNIIPKLYDSWTCKEQIVSGKGKITETLSGVLVLEKMKGSFYDVLNKLINSKAPIAKKNNTLSNYLSQVYHLLGPFKKLNILHLDLKPENILYKRLNGKVKLYITDFGISHDYLHVPVKNNVQILYDLYATPKSFQKEFDFSAFLMFLNKVYRININTILNIMVKNRHLTLEKVRIIKKTIKSIRKNTERYV